MIGLTGCVMEPVHLDVMSANGRDSGGVVPSYDSLIRIAAAARDGGDLPNALGVYRRASQVDPLNPAPLTGAGDVLLEMGSVNEAIVSYNNALLRDQQYLPALIGLARGIGPLLVAGTSGSPPGRWVAILALYDVVFALLSYAVFDFLLED